MELRLLIFFISIFCIKSGLQTTLISQVPDKDDYVVTHYNLEDGLPQSSVNDIIQAKDGYIWIATFGGLVRFDGNSFTTFDRSNTDGIGSDRILHLYEDRTGAIWLSTERGFTVYEDQKFKTFSLKNVGAINAPQRVVEDLNGRIWGLVDGVPYYINKDTLVKKNILINENLIEEALNDEKGAYLAYHKKLLHTLNDSLVLIKNFENELKSEISEITEYPKNSGIVYIGTSRDGLYKYTDGKLFSYKDKEGFSSNFIKRLFVDRDSTFWVTTYNGVSRFNGINFEKFSPIETDYEINFTKIFKDNEDNYWLGTLGDGMFSARPSIIKTIGKEEGFENDIMLSLSSLRDGRKLFSTNCGGIYEWFNGKLSYSVLNDHLPNLCVWSILEDSQDRIWFGAEELYRIESSDLSKKGEIIDTKVGFDGNGIHSIVEDSEGNIWIGALDGLFRYTGNKYKRYSTVNGLSSNNVRVIHESDSGILWVGTISGLNKVENEKITPVHLRTNLQKNVDEEPYVRAIYETDDGVLWIGSYGNGIFRLKNNEVCNITKENGLFDNIVSHLVKDDNDNFWMGSNRGIFRLSAKSASDFCDGLVGAVQSYSYGVQDGMISVETNGGFQPSVIKETSGDIYFPTVGGVSIVSTRSINLSNNQIPVYIERVAGSENEFSESKNIELSYNDSFLEIDYTAIHFTKPKKVQFRYRMQGLNDNWINAGSRRKAVFTKIPPGEYTFKVIAANNDGIWNDEGASLAITVIPPFWQTSWFIGLLMAFFIGSGYAFYLIRTNRLRKENERQKKFTEQLIESQEQERRRIASELHDGLGQQILVIKNRAELAKQEFQNSKNLSEQLEEILNSAMSSISDVRTISNALRPVLLEKFGLTDAVTELCDQLQQSSSIEWSYHVDNINEVIPSEKQINFYRVIQESINNILRHSKASEASVIIRNKEGGIYAVIWDNGVGFSKYSKSYSEGLGYLGMKERIGALGGMIRVHSIPGQETVIRISIPNHLTDKK